jgi:hypothetical protein
VIQLTYFTYVWELVVGGKVLVEVLNECCGGGGTSCGHLSLSAYARGGERERSSPFRS